MSKDEEGDRRGGAKESVTASGAAMASNHLESASSVGHVSERKIGVDHSRKRRDEDEEEEEGYKESEKNVAPATPTTTTLSSAEPAFPVGLHRCGHC